MAEAATNDFLAFRDYQRQLAQFQTGNREAMEQSERGESKPLDVESLIQRVHARLASPPDIRSARRP